MASPRQIEFIKGLQKQYGSEDFTEQEIKNMDNREVSKTIDKLKRLIAEEDLYNECMGYGLPNQ